MSTRPIGVFDSGLGGLTVLREIRRQLPRENLIYFGDIARLPYGIKSEEQILNFSIQNSLFLLKKQVKAIVIACNSSSSAAYRFLKQSFDVPVIDAITPVAEEAAEKTNCGKIGLIATQATVESRAYERALRSVNSKLQTVSYPCPLFVPLVEAGWLEDPITRQIVRRYLAPFKKHKIDTLILGCTHYPLLKSAIRREIGPKVVLVDSAKPMLKKLLWHLETKNLFSPKKNKAEIQLYVSDLPRNFKAIGEKFLGEKIKSIQVVRQV